MTDIMGFAQQHQIKVIEDAAQAIGVCHGQKNSGTFGEAGTYSFLANKTITTGEGGLPVTNDEQIYA